MNLFRSALVIATLGTALAAQANFINFDNVANGTLIGNAYLASDGVSFVNAVALRTSGSPTAPNALYQEAATLTINSPVNVLTTSVGLAYASTSSQTGGVPTLSVYSGLNGTGTLLGSLVLPDTSATTNNAYRTVALSFAGNARSFILNNSSFSRIAYDDLSFTSQALPVPEPASLAALGVGVATLLRKRRKA